MDLGLDDKVALVAASSKGLGRACALALAGEGARVAICARGAEQLESTSQEIREQTGAEVLAVAADLTQRADVERVVAATVERFGALDVLVANGGGPAVGKFPDLSDEDWLRGFEIVTLGFVRFVRAAVPHMRARGWGRIVGIQSISVKEPVEHIDLSNGIRPGVAGLAKALAPELARDGITINLVLPGIFLTSRIDPALGGGDGEREAQARERLAPLAATVPTGRLGDPAELGALVAFLASARAGYITGAVYQIDGGRLRANV
jgi:3-oxoacyl-[acyl-carrier protein] reductase